MGCQPCLRRRNTVCLLIPYCLAELVTIWKRRQRCISVMNLSVRGFVTLSLPGLRRSAPHLFAGNAGATELLCFCDNRMLYRRWRRCRHEQAWLMLEFVILIQSRHVQGQVLWNQMCFSYILGMRILFVYISCDMYLRLRLHVQIRLYYIFPYKAKNSTHHGIGFILDRCIVCIVYVGLTMPNLQKKRLLIF